MPSQHVTKPSIFYSGRVFSLIKHLLLITWGETVQSGVLEINAFYWLAIPHMAHQIFMLETYSSITGIGSQCLSSELPPDKLLFSWLVRPAGIMRVSTEVSCCTSQFLLFFLWWGGRARDRVISGVMEVAFQVKMFTDCEDIKLNCEQDCDPTFLNQESSRDALNNWRWWQSVIEDLRHFNDCKWFCFWLDSVKS